MTVSTVLALFNSFTFVSFTALYCTKMTLMLPREKAKEEHREPTQYELIEENRRLRSQNANLQDQIKQLKSQVLSLQRTIARIS